MLVLKLFLVPSLIGVITLVGRRWGPSVAGWLSAFPVVAGPILLLISLEQGPSFAATAAGGALVAVPSNAFFCLGYSWTATRYPWWISLMGALATYAVAAFLLTAIALPNLAVFLLTMIVLSIALRSFPGNIDARPATRPSPAELPARMITGAILVVAITISASHLGPRLSGLFSALPLMGCVLAVFSHPVSGAGAAIHLLRGMVSGFYSLSTFCFTLALALPAWGTAKGFMIALACATVVQLGSFWLRSSTLFQRKTMAAEVPATDSFKSEQ
jgi:hypothetical protein